MTLKTTILGLLQYAQGDDVQTYLQRWLPQSLRTTDALFDPVTGHNHTGTGTNGPTVSGPPGPTGPAGPTGPTGATGATGPGVASGGTIGQILVKNSSTNYDTLWQTPYYGYSSYTNSTNWERLTVGPSGTTNYTVSEAAGTGTYRDLVVGTMGGSANLLFRVAGTDRWTILSTGQLIANADATYDIGGAGSNRPRSLYLSANITCGGGITAGSDIRVSRGSTAGYVIFGASGSYNLQFDGTNFIFNPPAGSTMTTNSAVSAAGDVITTGKFVTTTDGLGLTVQDSNTRIFSTSRSWYFDQYNGSWNFRDSSASVATRFSCSAAGACVALSFTPTSAARLKLNIQPIADPLRLVRDEALHGITYDDRETGEHRVGFVADPWLQRLPEVVVLDEQGDVAALDYDRIGAVTFEALKHFVYETEARLAALERSNQG